MKQRHVTTACSESRVGLAPRFARKRFLAGSLMHDRYVPIASP